MRSPLKFQPMQAQQWKSDLPNLSFSCIVSTVTKSPFSITSVVMHMKFIRIINIQPLPMRPLDHLLTELHSIFTSLLRNMLLLCCSIFSKTTASICSLKSVDRNIREIEFSDLSFIIHLSIVVWPFKRFFSMPSIVASLRTGGLPRWFFPGRRSPAFAI
jgi:hypothetical protein